MAMATRFMAIVAVIDFYFRGKTLASGCFEGQGPPSDEYLANGNMAMATRFMAIMAVIDFYFRGKTLVSGCFEEQGLPS